MKAIFLSFFGLTLLGREVLGAQTLNEWLLVQVQSEERLLSDALSQTGGHSLQLLRDSRTYVPFFLEAPGNFTFSSEDQKASFDAWRVYYSSDFLSGGYIFRLRFTSSPALYATSSGDWSGNAWHSLDLDRDLAVEPTRVWNGPSDGELLSTMLTGISPRMVIYDRRGYVKGKEAFDVNAKDFDQRITTAEQIYSKRGAPALEMLSLVEYLENPNTPWRKADLSGEFNLRNQHLRRAERERLVSKAQLRRMGVVQALQSGAQVSAKPEALPPMHPQDAKKAADAKLPPITPGLKNALLMPGLLLGAAVIGLFLLLLRARR